MKDQNESLLENINNIDYEVKCTSPANNPFRYVIIDNFLKDSYYNLLVDVYYKVKDAGGLGAYTPDFNVKTQQMTDWSIGGILYRENSPYNLFLTN